MAFQDVGHTKQTQEMEMSETFLNDQSACSNGFGRNMVISDAYNVLTL